MKVKEICSYIKSKWNKDWIITLFVSMALFFSFFVPEQKNEFTKCFMNVVYIVAGGGGLGYMFYAIYVLLFNRIKLDLFWEKNVFLHKVVNMVLLVPFTMTMSYVVAHHLMGDNVEKYQNDFAKELAFSENMYDKDNNK